MTEPPRHPGELLVEVLTKLNRSQRWLASRTGLSTKHVNQVCKGVANIGPPSAVLFEEATGVEAETWMTLQVHYDIAVARGEAQRRPG
jgi:HTH-type transcriptional regulator/antitoxin HigA